jgi:arylsulfatase A-like enzyme
LLIINDDMGYSDIGCYGGEVETPNLDRLANNGLRLTQFYNTPRCSPSRASLLTGLYPHQTGIGVLTYPTGPEGYAGDLNQDCVTIAEVLGNSGYRTYMSGKWHVSSNLVEPSDSWPMQRGFDEFFGTIIGAGSFYYPNTLTRGNENIDHEARDDEDPFLYRRHQRPGRGLHPRTRGRTRRSTVFPVRCLYRAPLAIACPPRGYRKVPWPLRQGLGPACAKNACSA